jgi:hypothetical protein
LRHCKRASDRRRRGMQKQSAGPRPEFGKSSSRNSLRKGRSVHKNGRASCGVEKYWYG